MTMTNQEIIDIIIKKQNLTKEDVNKELKALYELIKDMEFDGKTPEETEAIKKEMATKRFITLYRKLLSSTVETFTGVFIGESGSMDMVAKRRKEAGELFKNDPQKAISKGITDSHGIPLYFATEEQQKTMPVWAKKRVGKPLPETDIQKWTIGLVDIKEKTIPMIFRIRGDNTKTVLPLFKQIKFNGVSLQSSTEELARINDAGSLNIRVEKSLSDIEIEAMFKKYFKNQIITLEQMEKFVQQHQEFNRFAIIKADIVSINPIPLANGTTIVNISDNTLSFIDAKGNILRGVTCWVPEYINIDFPENAEIWIIGVPNVNERGKSINAMGIYTPTMFKNYVPTKVDSIQKNTTEDDW